MKPVDEIEQQYLKLMRARLFQEAAELLAQAQETARREEDTAQASYLGSLRASTLIAAGRDEDALAAFSQAREDNPTDLFLRLRISTFLVLLQRPAEALAEIAPVAEDLLATSAVRHATLGTLGAAYLALGRTEEGRDCFRKMLQQNDLNRMDLATFDFVLVEALISQGELAEECRQYLEIVLARALSEEHHVTANRVRKLLQKLRV